MIPRTREEARALGVTKYLPEQPCKWGHVARRFVSSNRCEECDKKRKRENNEKQREAHKLWRANNPEKVQKAKQAWYVKNREKVLAGVKLYEAKNPDKVIARNNARRARKLNATPPWLTDQQKLEIRQKYTLARIHESVTGMKWHVDHIVPLRGRRVCGLHVPWNLQVIPATENFRKTNKLE